MKNTTLSYNGPRQIYTPNASLACDATASEGAASATGRIRIDNPDSRCRIKATLYFVPQAGLLVPGGGISQSAIWVHADEYNDLGGGSGIPCPVTDLEGTRAAPTSFPKSAGLLGYSREFVTAADVITLDVTYNSPGVAGMWMVKGQIQPDGVVLTWEEWDEIRREFQIQVLTAGAIASIFNPG